MSETADVVIVGGGPCGASAAALLAEHGRQVVVVEKERFPRYHIGESLIPYCWHALDRLGLVGRMQETGFVRKHSVQFARQNGECSRPFYFFQSLEHESAQTWQVERNTFDQMLLDNARAKGARVLEGTTALSFLEEGTRVCGLRCRSQAGEEFEIRSPVTLDAGGRASLALARRGWRQRDPELDRVAVWTYVRGAKRDPGLDEGATTIAYLPDKGWFWYIPQRDDIVSVGLVAKADYLFRDGRDPDEIWRRESQVNAWVASHVAGGSVCAPARVTAEYSYRSRYCASHGLVLAGDALAFLDPVFSSGLMFALTGGVMAADAIHQALARNDCSGAQFEPYAQRLCDGIDNMRRLVCAFYNPDFHMSALFKHHPETREEVTQCLIGNVFRDFSALHAAMAQHIELSPTLDYGRKAG